MNKQKLESDLDKITNYSTYVINCDEKNRAINFEIRNEDYTYDMLSAFAALFKTTKINVDRETREYGFCETCWSSEDVHIVYIRDIPEEFFKDYE